MLNLVVNKSLKAFNVFEFDIDFNTAYKLVQYQVEKINQINLDNKEKGGQYLKKLSPPLFAYFPQWNGDISWLSAGTKEAFHFFEKCFNELQIEEKTKKVANIDFPLMMYSGYFVVRSYGTASHFHVDYINTGINAFTILIPIQIDEKIDAGHLLYKDVFNKVSKYKYKKGKAITFGSDFQHSTEPFKSDKKIIFLCFAYGCKDLLTWEQIKLTAANQGLSYRHPNGKIIVTNSEFEKYF